MSRLGIRTAEPTAGDWKWVATIQTMHDATQLPAWGVMVADTMQWVGKAHTLGKGPQCQAEAHANAGLFAASKAMAELLEEATKAWAEQFDGPDDRDCSVSGADLMDWSRNGAFKPARCSIWPVCHERGATGCGHGDAGRGLPVAVLGPSLPRQLEWGGHEKGGWWFEAAGSVTASDLRRAGSDAGLPPFGSRCRDGRGRNANGLARPKRGSAALSSTLSRGALRRAGRAGEHPATLHLPLPASLWASVKHSSRLAA